AHAHQQWLRARRNAVAETGGFEARADVVELAVLAPVDAQRGDPVVVQASLRLQAGQDRYVVLWSWPPEDDAYPGLSFHAVPSSRRLRVVIRQVVLPQHAVSGGEGGADPRP